MDGLLPAHCGYKKASGKNERENAGSNNWPTLAALTLRARAVAPQSGSSPLTRLDADHDQPA
jgi:hypothetical protein